MLHSQAYFNTQDPDEWSRSATPVDKIYWRVDWTWAQVRRAR
jgi:hypothetical protein